MIAWESLDPSRNQQPRKGEMATFPLAPSDTILYHMMWNVPPALPLPYLPPPQEKVPQLSNKNRGCILYLIRAEEGSQLHVFAHLVISSRSQQEGRRHT